MIFSGNHHLWYKIISQGQLGVAKFALVSFPLKLNDENPSHLSLSESKAYAKFDSLNDTLWNCCQCAEGSRSDGRCCVCWHGWECCQSRVDNVSDVTVRLVVGLSLHLVDELGLDWAQFYIKRPNLCVYNLKKQKSLM